MALFFKYAKEKVYHGSSVTWLVHDIINKQCYNLSQKDGHVGLSQIVFNCYIQLKNEIETVVDSIPNLNSSDTVTKSFHIGLFLK